MSLIAMARTSKACCSSAVSIRAGRGGGGPAGAGAAASDASAGTPWRGPRAGGWAGGGMARLSGTGERLRSSPGIPVQGDQLLKDD